jgi:hypothetical protein
MLFDSNVPGTRRKADSSEASQSASESRSAQAKPQKTKPAGKLTMLVADQQGRRIAVGSSPQSNAVRAEPASAEPVRAEPVKRTPVLQDITIDSGKKSKGAVLRIVLLLLACVVFVLSQRIAFEFVFLSIALVLGAISA